MLHYKNFPRRGANIPWRRRERNRSFGGKIAMLSHKSSTLSWHKVHVFMAHDVDILVVNNTRIQQAKRHSQILKSTPWCCESCFILIFFSNQHLIVARKSIQHGHDLRSCDPLQQSFHIGEGIVVFNACQIQIYEIYT
jgi:hypothetical protein